MTDTWVPLTALRSVNRNTKSLGRERGREEGWAGGSERGGEREERRRKGERRICFLSSLTFMI